MARIKIILESIRYHAKLVDSAGSSVPSFSSISNISTSFKNTGL